jgi:hypothetical protein
LLNCVYVCCCSALRFVVPVPLHLLVLILFPRRCYLIVQLIVVRFDCCCCCCLIPSC